MDNDMTPVEKVVEARERLEAQIILLAREVSQERPAGDLDYQQADAIIREWGHIPPGTMDEIAEMHRLLGRLSGLKALPALQARLALAPVNSVVDGLGQVIDKVRERKSGAA